MWKSILRILFPADDPPPAILRGCENKVYAELYSSFDNSNNRNPVENPSATREPVVLNLRG